MDCPKKPQKWYFEKVEQEKYFPFSWIGNKEVKISLEGVDYTNLKVTSDGVTFQKIVHDPDKYNEAILKYEENYKAWKQWKKEQKPIKIVELEAEILKLQKELEAFNESTL